MNRSPLPIDPLLPEILAALRTSNALVLQAPTGAGKTTRVPPALLEGGFAERGQIIVLEPRRLAARAAARRMAQERDEKVGDTVGYQVRFDRQAGPNTRILVVTEGLLLRLLSQDPFLENVGAILFDELHERHLDTDLSLGIARLLQQTVRPDLRLVAMSATITTENLARFLGHCPVITSEGRLFPVEVRYQPRPMQEPLGVSVANAVEKVLNQTPGDVLVFLPGVGEIRQSARQLEGLAQVRNLAIFPLFGDLPAEEQDAALLPGPRRKIVLATNVAETSVTVEGISAVIDTGLARIQNFDPHVGLDRLELTQISQASADQRKGRAGRTQAGLCVRLWSETFHRSRPADTEPEIRRVDLAGAVLQLANLGEKDFHRFPWFEPPAPESLDHAIELLGMLGALEGNHITPLGQALARLPVHPRLGRLLLEGQERGIAPLAALAAAFLSEREPFLRNGPRQPPASSVSDSDLLDRLHALENFEARGRAETPFGPINRGAAGFMFRVRDQLLREISSSPPAPGGRGQAEAFLRSLLVAFPDRVCRRRLPGSPRGRMVGGKGVKLAPSSAVTQGELFLALDVDAGREEALVRIASRIERDWLPPEDLKSTIEVEYQEGADRVSARKRLCFFDLQLEESPANLDEETAARVLALAALERWDRVRPAPDTSAGQFLVRVRWLREWMPELDLPTFDDQELKTLLPAMTPGCRSLADLRKADWLGFLQGKLTYPQRQAVDRHAPERIEVPSGSRLALTYEAGKAPVLAVRIQEVFGWAQTPRIAGGRVPVLLHLLAPNSRPQQITDDLASFWANTYPQVRKDLRARYPKHSWPEDPWNAEALRGPKRKGT